MVNNAQHELVAKAHVAMQQMFAAHDGKLSGRIMTIHAERCASMGRDMGARQGLNVDALMIAGYLHDVGRTINDDESHTLEGAKIVELFFQEHNVHDATLKDIIIDCTLNHGSKAKPMTQEGKLMQFIDKAALIDVSVISVLIEEFSKSMPLQKAREKAKQKLESRYRKIGDNRDTVQRSYEECLSLFAEKI